MLLGRDISSQRQYKKLLVFIKFPMNFLTSNVSTNVVMDDMIAYNIKLLKMKVVLQKGTLVYLIFKTKYFLDHKRYEKFEVRVV